MLHIQTVIRVLYMDFRNIGWFILHDSDGIA